MKKLKELLAAYFKPYEQSGMNHGNPACSTDELAEAIVAACNEGIDDTLRDIAGEAGRVGDDEAAAVVAKKPKKAKPAADAGQ